MRRRLAVFLFALLLIAPLGVAANSRDPLTAAEVDQLREAAQDPETRMKLFVDFAGARMLAIEQLRADPKLNENRGQRIHDLLTDFLSICESLEDNLDMYSRQHADLRKPLKHAIEAYTNWQLRLRTLKDSSKSDAKAAAEFKEYDFVLESASDAVNGGLQSSREMLDEQNKRKQEEKKKK
jgi:hypothetical protein